MRGLWSLVAALLAAPVAAEGGALGGWTETNVTAETAQLLADALTRGDAQYGAAIRVCFIDILSVETQVVAGTNYRFVISGCDVTADGGADAAGECADDVDNVPVGGFVVTVFEQPWTDTLRVTNVSAVDLMHVESFAEEYDRDDKEAGYGNDDAVEDELEALELEEDEDDAEMEEKEYAEDEDADTDDVTEELAVSNEEKADIDAWLEDNKDSVNEFGDPAGTYYTGGTPLFDETTGKVIDKYEYIVRRHPDRPWSAGKADAMATGATLRSNMLATESENAVATGGSSFGTLAKVIGSLGMFAGALVAVAAAKMQRGRTARRFPYHPINGRGVL